MRRPAAATATAAVAIVAAALVLAACGTPSPDLFVVHRTGTLPGAKLDLLVSDTTARCNTAAPREMSSPQILEARDILKDLLEFQRGRTAVPPAPAEQFFHFVIRSEAGTLRYGDTTQRPSVLPRITRFTRDLAKSLCGLAR